MRWPLETFDAVELLRRVPLATVMVLGSVGKVLNFKDFCKILKSYNIVPQFLAPTVSVVFVVSELAVAVGLVLSDFAVWGGLTGAVLLLMYSTAIAINLIRGRREIPCGCNIRNGQTISWWLVLRNVGLIGIALIGTGKLVLVLPASVLVFVCALGTAFRLVARTSPRSVIKEVS